MPNPTSAHLHFVHNTDQSPGAATLVCCRFFKRLLLPLNVVGTLHRGAARTILRLALFSAILVNGESQTLGVQGGLRLPYALSTPTPYVSGITLANHTQGNLDKPIVPNKREEHWGMISNFFAPPAEFKGAFGEYRSPLLFKDGSQVKSPLDWQKRRIEILETWHGSMGKWPQLLKQPRLEIITSEPREDFTQHKVRVEVAPGQHEPGYLLVPKGKGPFPAVVVPFYEPETSIGLKGAFRDFGLQLTRRGFVSLNIGSPGGNARDPSTGEALCQPLSFLAYVAANCHTILTKLPDVNKDRIGIVGHSYGGKWAMFAACLYPEFAAGAWSDPGIMFDETRSNVNYWEPWYLGHDPIQKRKPGIPNEENPRTGAYRKMIEEGRDLHELHALMAPRPFLVSGGAEDPVERWIPLNHTIAVNQLLGHTNKVGMTNRPAHDPNEESNLQIYSFFEHFLGTAQTRKRQLD